MPKKIEKINSSDLYDNRLGTFEIEVSHKIKPCPFCSIQPVVRVERQRGYSENSKINEYFRVFCKTCVQTNRANSLDGALIIWNRRNNFQTKTLSERFEKFRDTYFETSGGQMPTFGLIIDWLKQQEGEK